MYGTDVYYYLRWSWGDSSYRESVTYRYGTYISGVYSNLLLLLALICICIGYVMALLVIVLRILELDGRIYKQVLYQHPSCSFVSIHIAPAVWPDRKPKSGGPSILDGNLDAVTGVSWSWLFPDDKKKSLFFSGNRIIQADNRLQQILVEDAVVLISFRAS